MREVQVQSITDRLHDSQIGAYSRYLSCPPWSQTLSPVITPNNSLAFYRNGSCGPRKRGTRCYNDSIWRRHAQSRDFPAVISSTQRGYSCNSRNCIWYKWRGTQRNLIDCFLDFHLVTVSIMSYTDWTPHSVRVFIYLWRFLQTLWMQCGKLCEGEASMRCGFGFRRLLRRVIQCQPFCHNCNPMSFTDRGWRIQRRPSSVRKLQTWVTHIFQEHPLNTVYVSSFIVLLPSLRLILLSKVVLLLVFHSSLIIEGWWKS